MGNVWQHNIKDFIFKNGIHKCKQCTQKVADNCIKYFELKRAEMTSFLLEVRFTHCDSTIHLSLFQSIKHFEQWENSLIGEHSEENRVKTLRMQH